MSSSVSARPTVRRAEDQVLKKVDADTVFLVDSSFRFLKTAPAQWLNKEILDVNAEDVNGSPVM